MTGFAAKPLPSDEKLRGGYYTPDPIASYLAKWVGETGQRLLEPSCGDGAILRRLADLRGKEVQGVERLPSEAAKARTCTSGNASVKSGDFFHWFTNAQHGRWDGVAGNPPYIRFGHWPESDRTQAFKLMEHVGLKPSRLTNAWVPFTVGSVLALRARGRVGLVLPAELLQVSYAAQLREFLLDELSELNLISFRCLVFPEILQEVVLVLGVRGTGPPAIRTAEVNDASDLTRIDWKHTAAAPALRHDREKWTKYFLQPAEIDDMRWAREEGGLVPLGTHASVDVGVVTGRNSFFTMTPTEATERGIPEFCVPLVARSAQLSGLRYETVDLAKDQANDVRCLLLALNGDVGSGPHSALATYLRAGEAARVQDGYKCRIRREWWSVPSVWTPDAFMLRQIHKHPIVIANHTCATSTDTVHRVRMRSNVSVDRVAAATINSATFAFAEVLGRSYGGGILELEPREAEQLPIPPPDPIPKTLARELNELLRNGERDEALELGDTELLINECGWKLHYVEHLRSAWIRLRDRRARRGRSHT